VDLNKHTRYSLFPIKVASCLPGFFITQHNHHGSNKTIEERCLGTRINAYTTFWWEEAVMNFLYVFQKRAEQGRFLFFDMEEKRKQKKTQYIYNLVYSDSYNQLAKPSITV
jgi:hypothetical protein